MTTQPATYSDPLVTEVRDAAARLLFQLAWADACDEGTCPACDSNGAFDDGDPQCKGCDRTIPMAGSGENWSDALSHLPTPIEATLKADKLIQALGGEADAFDYLCAWDTAIQQPDELGVAEFELLDDSADRFGTCLAFQALGHGVSLSDDIPLGVAYTRPTVPLIEFHASMFDGADVLAKASKH